MHEPCLCLPPVPSCQKILWKLDHPSLCDCPTAAEPVILYVLCREVYSVNGTVEERKKRNAMKQTKPKQKFRLCSCSVLGLINNSYNNCNFSNNFVYTNCVHKIILIGCTVTTLLFFWFKNRQQTTNRLQMSHPPNDQIQIKQIKWRLNVRISVFFWFVLLLLCLLFLGMWGQTRRPWKVWSC